MTLDESERENDRFQNVDGLKIAYDLRSSRYLENAGIVYSDKWWNKGLQVQLNQTYSC